MSGVQTMLAIIGTFVPTKKSKLIKIVMVLIKKEKLTENYDDVNDSKAHSQNTA
jgi:hypothetical protein